MRDGYERLSFLNAEFLLKYLEKIAHILGDLQLPVCPGLVIISLWCKGYISKPISRQWFLNVITTYPLYITSFSYHPVNEAPFTDIQKLKTYIKRQPRARSLQEVKQFVSRKWCCDYAWIRLSINDSLQEVVTLILLNNL